MYFAAYNDVLQQLKVRSKYFLWNNIIRKVKQIIVCKSIHHVTCSYAAFSYNSVTTELLPRFVVEDGLKKYDLVLFTIINILITKYYYNIIRCRTIHKKIQTNVIFVWQSQILLTIPFLIYHYGDCVVLTSSEGHIGMRTDIFNLSIWK